MSARAASRVARGPGSFSDSLRVYDLASRMERRIRELDREAAGVGRAARVVRAEARQARLHLIHVFALSYLPATAEGSALVVRLGRFLEDHAERLGPELLDALAARLDPRPESKEVRDERAR